MAVAQFAEFVQACEATSVWQQTISEQGIVTLYKAVKHLVKPWTRGTGCSIALRMNESGPRDAEVMVSHCWAECLLEATEALQIFMAQASLQSSVAIWFCAFAQYQCGDEIGDPGPTVSEQLSQDPFGSVIKHVSPDLGMVVVQTSQADVYSRLWCVYEISVAVTSKARVAMTYSKAALKNRKGSFVDMLYAKTSEAKCGSVKDADMIKAKVEQSGGFEFMDGLIFKFRMACFSAMLKLLDGEERQTLQLEMLEIKSKLLATDALRFEQEAVSLRMKTRRKATKWQVMFCMACPFLVLALPLLLLVAPCIYVCFYRRRVAQVKEESQEASQPTEDTDEDEERADEDEDEEEARRNELARERLKTCLDVIDESHILLAS
eukprot:TRINITY_DN42974_c0_g1_i1.p1 TRINITY_DN42974_c0_g1~~TRINITY_DN42974_c0_g1_i1.p1  ORF type:complete len:422 (-),score=74.49 TRINITY_DN42974_c0_g1_i1:40-1173(-)